MRDQSVILTERTGDIYIIEPIQLEKNIPYKKSINIKISKNQLGKVVNEDVEVEKLALTHQTTMGVQYLECIEYNGHQAMIVLGLDRVMYTYKID